MAPTPTVSAISRRRATLAEDFLERGEVAKFHSINFVETHVLAVQAGSMRSSLAAAGRRPFLVGARPTGRSDDGTSGGVVAAPRIGIQLDDMAVSSGKSSWKVEGLDWRLVLYRARHFTYSMVTLYLTCGIGYTGENVRKLSEVARAIKAAGVPFLIVADWNMQPDELQRSGFLDLVEGVLAVPADLDYTCISGRLLDYAVVHPGLAPAVQLMHYSKAPGLLTGPCRSWCTRILAVS